MKGIRWGFSVLLRWPSSAKSKPLFHRIPPGWRCPGREILDSRPAMLGHYHGGSLAGAVARIRYDQ